MPNHTITIYDAKNMVIAYANRLKLAEKADLGIDNDYEEVSLVVDLNVFNDFYTLLRDRLDKAKLNEDNMEIPNKLILFFGVDKDLVDPDKNQQTVAVFGLDKNGELVKDAGGNLIAFERWDKHSTKSPSVNNVKSNPNILHQVFK